MNPIQSKSLPALAAALAAAVLTTIPARGAPWTPADLPGQAALWLDASTATSNAGTVSISNAGSGGGTISGPASLVANGIGNLQAVQFNGTNQYVTGNYTNTGTTLSAFFVGKSLNSTQNSYAGMMSVRANASANDWDNAGSACLFTQYLTTANSITTFRNSDVLSGTNGTLTTAFLADTIFNGTTDLLYLNGSPAAGVASSGSFNAGKVVLGSRWTASAPSHWWKGNFGEAIICNANLSIEDRQKLEGYLAWKWGLQASLPSDHPYKSAAPESSGSSYDTWANGTFTPALTAKLPTDNQDGDSLNNLQEFAFGTQPTVSTGEIVYSGGALTTPGAPKIVAAAGTYSMVFGRRADYVAAGLTYTVQFSAGLDAWVDNNDGTNPPVQVATDGTINAMSVPYVDFIDTPSGSRKPTFSRVKVVQAP